MARPRYQRGFIEETGKIVSKWKVHWYVWITDDDGNEDRRHRSRVIGRKPVKGSVRLNAADAALPIMTRAEAQAELDRIIAVEVGGAAPRKDGSTRFGDFYRERWLPLREGTWRTNTKLTNLGIYQKHLEPEWGCVRLDQIDAPAAAKWLAGLAETYSSSLVHKCRTYLKSIVTEAVDQGYLPRDPLRKVRRPKVKRKPDKSFLTAEEVERLRGEMRGFRDQLILDILLATGMRAGELFALRWSDVLDGALFIDEGFTRGELQEPKTPGSLAPVAVPAEIMDRIAFWCHESKPENPQRFIFPSEEGTPIFSENWRKRVLYPAAKLAGVRVNYQIIRRTLATLAINGGVSAKAVQAQLRHASIETTLNVYAQTVTAAQGVAAERMFQVMRGAGKEPEEE